MATKGLEHLWTLEPAELQKLTPEDTKRQHKHKIRHDLMVGNENLVTMTHLGMSKP